MPVTEESTKQTVPAVSSFENETRMQPAHFDPPIADKSIILVWAAAIETSDRRTWRLSTSPASTNDGIRSATCIICPKRGAKRAYFACKDRSIPRSSFSEQPSPRSIRQISSVSSCEKANCRALRTSFFPVTYNCESPTMICWYLYTFLRRMQQNSRPSASASPRA